MPYRVCTSALALHSECNFNTVSIEKPTLTHTRVHICLYVPSNNLNNNNT